MTCTVPDMELTDLAKHWTTFGRTDPLWAVLSDPSKKFGRWDPEEFMASGRAEIGAVMARVDAAAKRGGFRVGQGGRALDFGCGVGRLTLALSECYPQVDGVDIAPTMIDAARKMVPEQGAPRHLRFHLNETSDLSLFSDSSFDFVYTSHVLQHMEPRYSKAYIAEFFRILRPEGVALFELVTERVTGRGEPLPDDGFAATIVIGAHPDTLMTGQKSLLPVTVRNNGSTTLPAVGVNGWFQVMVGNHWADAAGNRVVDDGRVGLPHDLDPGAECTVELEIAAPQKPGDYAVSVDCVQEGVAWFESKGSTVATRALSVQPALIPTASEPLPEPPRWRRVAGQLLAGRREQVPSGPAPEPHDQAGVAEDHGTVTDDNSSDATMEMHGVTEDEVREIVEVNDGEIREIIDWDEISGQASLDWHRRGFLCTKK